MHCLQTRCPCLRQGLRALPERSRAHVVDPGARFDHVVPAGGERAHAKIVLLAVALRKGRLVEQADGIDQIALDVQAEAVARGDFDGAGYAVHGRPSEHVGINTLRNLVVRSAEHPSELQSLIRLTYAGLCFKKNNNAYLPYRDLL